MTSTPATGSAADVCIRRGNLRSPVAVALIGALNDELSKRYPEPGATHFRLDPDESRTGGARFSFCASASMPPRN